jgi:pimeloyl-ACP methyl ester carboxylesterase
MKKLYIIFLFALFFCHGAIAQEEYKYPCGVYFVSMEPKPGPPATLRDCYSAGDFTLSAWIQLRDEEWGGKAMHIFQREQAKFPSYDGFNFYLATDGILKFSTYIMKDGTGVLDSISSGIRPEPFKWHHIALSYESGGNGGPGSCKMYINGNQVTAGSFAGPRIVDPSALSNNTFVAIGGIMVFNGAGSSNYKGYIDEVAFCWKALTKEQIDVLAKGLLAGDPLILEYGVAAYQKNDTYPHTVNSGIYGYKSNSPIGGQKYQCPVDNQPPVADAGADQVINPPANSATLDGNASKDPDGSIVSFTWTKLSGPQGDQSSIVNPNSVTTAVTGLKEGEYVFELTVKDDKGSEAKAVVKVRVNEAPVIKMFNEWKITLPEDSASLYYSSIEDNDGIASIIWSQVSGPSDVEIVDMEYGNEKFAFVKKLKAGEYYFKLSVTDNLGAKASAIVKVIVNIPPIADAGDDITISLPEDSVTLKGIGKDSDGNIVEYKWKATEAPYNSFTFEDSTKSETKVFNLEQGEYEFELMVIDNYYDTAYDRIKVTVNPELKVKLIDPFPSMIDQGHIHSNIADIDTLNIVRGVAADGVSKLIVYIKTGDSLRVSIDEATSSEGTLSMIDGNNSESSASLVLHPVDSAIAFIYNAPDGYGNERLLPERYVTISITSLNDPSKKAEAEIIIMPPPLVLIHGMWSSPNAWKENGFEQYLNDEGNWFKNIQLVDYSKYAHLTFDPGSVESNYAKRALLNAITRGILQHKDYFGIVASQVDVVGHSLGGLMTRSFIQWNEKNIQSRNYNQGYIHKLITLGTPHIGSPLGPLLYNLEDYVHIVGIISGNRVLRHLPVNVILKWIGNPVGSVHKDFETNVSKNPALKRLESTSRYNLKRVHAVVGIAAATGKDIEGIEQFAKLVLRKESLDDIFLGEHDLIVERKSQLGGLQVGNAATIFSNTTHSNPPGFATAGFTTETSNRKIFEHVYTLLKSSESAPFANGFPAPAEISNRTTEKAKKNKISKRVTSNDSAYIRLKDQSRAIVISPEQTEIEISFETFNNAVIRHPLCLIEEIGWFAFPEKTPYTLKIPVPENVAGKLFYSVLARDTSGVLLADTSHMQLNPKGNFLKLEAEPYLIRLDSVVKESQVSATAYYAFNGDTLLYRVDPATGLKYKHHTNNIEINSGGTVQALQPGLDTVEVIYQNQVLHIPVEVSADFSSSNKMSSYITFDIDEKKIDESPIILNATVSSGNDVSFELLSGPVELENGVVIFKDTGTVIIRASAPGNAYFNAPPDVIQTFKILPNLQAQTLTFNSIPVQTFGNPPVPLNATTSSDLPVTYTVVFGPGEIKGDSLVIYGAGTIVVKAMQEGNDNYNPVSAEQTIIVEKAAQTLVLHAASTKTYGDPPIILNAASSSDLPITYTVVSGPGELKGDSLVITGAGEIVVKAIQEGNNNYEPASAEQTIVVAKANQTIVIDLIPSQTFGNPPILLGATSSSHLPVTFTVVSGPGTIKGDSLLITGAGEIVVKAVQDGNSNHTSAADEQTIIVNKALQTLVFDSIPSRSYSQGPVILAGSSSSGLPVVYTVVSGPATVTGNSLLMTGTGTVVVQATQPGNNNYNAADTIQRTFCVTASQPVAINGDTLSCTGTLTYFINAKWGTNYQWAVSGNASVKTLSDTSIAISYTEPGYYSISATPGNTCSSPAETFSVHITQGPAKPVITPVNDSVLTSGIINGNQWFINGSIIPGATRQQYVPSQAGDYTVQVNVDGCISLVSDAYHFSRIDLPPAADTSLLEDAIKLYPNPFDHTLKVLNKRNIPVGLRLYDVTGREVLYTKIRPGAQDIPTGHLQRGMYMALLINLKEGTWARKILLKL